MSLDGMDRFGNDSKRSGACWPVLELGRQRIVQGDCLAYLPNIPGKDFDVIVTSPPYNLGVQYATYDDRRPRRDYLDWLGAVGLELRRVLKDDGSFFLNIGGSSIDPWIPMDVAEVFRGLFRLQNQIVWVKSVAIHEKSVGHFKPVNSQRFLNNNHEFVFHFTKSGSVNVDRLAVGVPYMDKTNITRWSSKDDKRCAGNVWFVPYKTAQSRRDKFNHPAGFPVCLPKRCIELHGRRDAVVLDPFLGTGATLLAAKELGLKGTGVELDKHYVAAAFHRLKEHL